MQMFRKHNTIHIDSIRFDSTTGLVWWICAKKRKYDESKDKDKDKNEDIDDHVLTYSCLIRSRETNSPSYPTHVLS